MTPKPRHREILEPSLWFGETWVKTQGNLGTGVRGMIDLILRQMSFGGRSVWCEILSPGRGLCLGEGSWNP